MITYVTLSVVVLGLLLLVTARTVSRLPRRPLVLTGALLLGLTAVFDNVIVAAGIVGYDDSLILGVRVPVAPIEDFAYALGALLLVPTLWEWSSRLVARRPESPLVTRTPGAPSGSAAPAEDAEEAG